MRRCGVLTAMMLLSLTLTLGWAQELPNLVTAHQAQTDESGNMQIDFTLSEVPEKAMLAFDIRFEPRFV